MKKILSLLLALTIIFTSANAAFAPQKPIPKQYRLQPLRQKILTIAESQKGYEQGDDGSTVYHHDLFFNPKPSSYLYNCDWCTVFLAWTFKKATIYTPVFADYPATSVKVMAYRFLTAGKVFPNSSIALFDNSYLSKVQAGDILFYDYKMDNKTNYSNLENFNNFNHAGFVSSVDEDGTINVIEGNFKNKVWTGKLDNKNKRHNKNKVIAVGVLDLKPQKEQDFQLKTPLLAFNKQGEMNMIYYIYKDGTCLTSNGETPFSNFANSINIEQTTTDTNIMAFADEAMTKSYIQIPAGTKLEIINKKDNAMQVAYNGTISANKSEFKVNMLLWIKN